MTTASATALPPLPSGFTLDSATASSAPAPTPSSGGLPPLPSGFTLDAPVTSSAAPADLPDIPGIKQAADIGLTFGSRAVAPLAGGLTYLGTLIASGNPSAASAVQRQTQGELTYQPETGAGRTALGGVQRAVSAVVNTAPVKAVTKAYGRAIDVVGGYSPVLGAAMKAAPTAAATLLPGGAVVRALGRAVLPEAADISGLFADEGATRAALPNPERPPPDTGIRPNGYQPEDFAGPAHMPETAPEAAPARAAPKAAPSFAPKAAPPSAPAVAPSRKFLDDFNAKFPVNPADPTQRLVNGNVGIEAYQDPFDANTVHLSTVRANTPGQGHGGAAMQQITQLADQHGVRLTLDAVPLDENGISSDQLRNFYEAHGFRSIANNDIMPMMERRPGGASQPLPGMPATANVNGHTVTVEPNNVARGAAESYAAEAGIPYEAPSSYVQPDAQFLGRVAQAYDAMEHTPDDPAVQKAYSALIEETLAQYGAATKAGLKVQFIQPGSPDPYHGQPRGAIEDIRHNNHLWVYPTESGFGGPTVNIGLHTEDGKGITAAQATSALEKTGAKVTASAVHQSNTEPTLVARLNRPLTPAEAHQVAVDTHQQSIAHMNGTHGELYGPGAAQWRPFNPDYFLTLSGQPASSAAKHPMLAPTNVTFNGQPANANDVFRAVHDYFGHAAEGNGFGPRGEYNAYRYHRAMYSPAAQPALATETLGQNAWVNYGPHAYENAGAGPSTIYAEQKAGLLPPEFLENQEPTTEVEEPNLEEGAPQRPEVATQPGLPGSGIRHNTIMQLRSPTAEGTAHEAVPTLQQHENERLLRAIGLTEARESAITGDTREAGTDFQTSRLKDNAAGDRMAEVIHAERAALRDFGGVIVHEAGGLAGNEQSARLARGKANADAVEAYEDTLDARMHDLYAKADAAAGGKGVTKLQEVSKILSDPEFQNTLLARDQNNLLTAVKGQLTRYLTINPQGLSPRVAEQFRQWLQAISTPQNAKAIAALKDAVDESVTKAAGGVDYLEGRAIRALKFQNLESPKGISRLVAPHDRNGINRSVALENIPSYVLSMPVEQFTHYVNVLHTAARDGANGYGEQFGLVRKATDAINALRTQVAQDVLDAGTSTQGMWNSKAVYKYLAAHQSQVAQLFTPAEVKRFETLNNAGVVLSMDRSYPGAAAQQHNFVTRGVLGAVSKGAEAVGAHLGGLPGWVVGKLAGHGAEHLNERALSKAVESRIRDLTGPFEPIKPPRGSPAGPGAKQRGGPKFVAPKQLYHGSRAAFDTFKGGRGGMVFLSESPEFAEQYGAVKSVTAPLKKVADLDTDARARKIAIQNFEKSGKQFTRGVTQLWELTEAPGFVVAMRRHGYDGASFNETSSDGTNTARTVAVFDPTAVAEHPVAKYLTPQEKTFLSRDSAFDRMVDAFHNAPPAHELAAMALAGRDKRGWYERAAQSIAQNFGPDAPRFTALLAAMSPRTGVEENFKNAMRSFLAWEKAGRPTEGSKIAKVLGSSVRENGGKMLANHYANSVRALQAKEPENLTLSGPKVQAFARALHNDVNAVVLDSWMANVARINPKLLNGNKRGAEAIRGPAPTYLGYTAKVRETAALLSHMTGEHWTPREVQETVWSWAKTATEHTSQYGALATIPELVKSGELKDELVRGTPEFSTLFGAPDVQRAIAASRDPLGNARVPRAPDWSAEPSAPSKKAAAARRALQGHLESAAARLEKSRTKR